MSHNPPVPENAVSPFPLGSSQAADRNASRQDLAEQTAENLKADPAGRGPGVKIAVGAAIGSAAIAAALLYYNRSK